MTKTPTKIPLELISADPNQPRKHFDPEKIAELGASISEHGLIQPITVRPDPAAAGRFIVIAGERRYRAHLAIGAKEIDALVDNDAADSHKRAMVQLIENIQRADMTFVEEGRAFQRAMDETGLTVDALARQLGFNSPWKVARRTALLKLRPEYAALVDAGQLHQSLALEMAKFEPRLQDALFGAIKRGDVTSLDDLRAARDAVMDAQEQGFMFDEPAPPTKADKAASTKLERAIDDVMRLCSECFRENEIVAVAKVQPHNVKGYADKLELAAKTLQRVAVEMRKERFTRDLLSGSASTDISVGTAVAA